ncbi:MAG: hypothetical protein V2A73_14850, partial [Pseudomonadota bacterium]
MRLRDALRGRAARIVDDFLHGNLGGGTLHADATAIAAGFMSAAQFSKLDGIEAGADVTDEANVRAALAALTTTATFNSRALTTIGSISVGNSGVVTIQYDAIGSAQVAGLTLQNTTAAADGVQQNSPLLVLAGQGYKSDAVAASQ